MDLHSHRYRGKIISSALISALITLVVAVIFFLPGLLQDALGEDSPRVAGLAGPILALLLLFSLSFLLMTRTARRRKKLLSRPFPSEWEEELDRRVPFFRSLSPPERERFGRQVLVFLGEKKISGIKTEVDDASRLLVAASAIIPVFGLPDWEYRQVSEVLLYPSDFDEDYSFVSRRRGFMGMVVSPSSTVIIAKPALFEGWRRRRDRLNTGLHEFLHKVDGEDGAVDGVPSLLLDAVTREQWTNIVRKETALIRRRRSDIDLYATQDESEFFPVVGEYFFESPALMASRHPELFTLLVKMFRQDPRHRSN